jgi:very-short-patch-repair endonuclease
VWPHTEIEESADDIGSVHSRVEWPCADFREQFRLIQVDSATVTQRILGNQGGIAKRRQLLAAGVGSRWLRRRLADARLEEPFPGVVCSPGVVHTYRGQVRAGLVYAGDGSCLSHGTALAHFGLAPTPLPGSDIHISVPHGRHLTMPPGLRIHQIRWPRPTIEDSGLTVVAPAHTIADLAGVLRLNDLRCVAAEAVTRGLIRLEELSAARIPRGRGAVFLDLLLEELRAGAASGAEACYWRAVVSAGLPPPELNVEVETDEGLRIVDGLWREFRLGVEIDGRSVHAQAEAFDRDRHRQNLIHREGIVLLRFSAAQVFGEHEWVVAQTVANLRSRAEELGLPFWD